MTLYYDGGDVQLYHGDCREIDAWLAADILLVDPPYGIAYESNWNNDRRNAKMGRSIIADDTTTLRDSLLSAWGGRPALVFGRWDAPRPPGTRKRLIWDKGASPGLGDLSLPWGQSDEEVYVLGSGWSGPRSGSVLRRQMLVPSHRNRPDHPTPKPVPLLCDLITKCPPGVLADPCAGSGSLGVAARLSGRRAVLVEIEERYCEIAARRLDQGVLDLGAPA